MGVVDVQGVQSSEQVTAAISEAAAAGDAAAFGQLYDLYLDRVYRYVYYRLGNRQDAEDVTEQVFLRALQAINRFRCDDSPFIAWLLGIARNAVIDHVRARKSTHPLNEALVDKGQNGDPGLLADMRCTHEQLRQAILGLKPEYREVIVLRFVEELDHAQTAASLSRSEGAVRVLQHRALCALRQALGKEVR